MVRDLLAALGRLGACVRLRLAHAGKRIVLVAQGVVQAAYPHLHPLVGCILGALRRLLTRDDRQIARLDLRSSSSEVALVLFQRSGVHVVAGFVR